jgi:polysaccharide export outer membrane protein
MTGVLLAGFVLAGVPLAVLQAPVTATPTATPTAEATAQPVEESREYQIGSGDILEIDVFGNDDLSRTATVQPDGRITLPLLGDVTVGGLTPRETAVRLTELLGRDYLVNPQVDVRVKEYLSQYVTVVGEVQSPGRKPLKGRTRLIDALVDAGGLTTRASGEVIVTRISGGFPDGYHTLTVRLGGALTPASERVIETILRNGDVVTVSSRHYITVEGEVQRPNRYVVDSELTVSGAISLAGGLTRFGGGNVRVRRVDPATGKTEILEVDLKAIRKGKQTDLILQPNDAVSVPRRLF